MEPVVGARRSLLPTLLALLLLPAASAGSTGSELTAVEVEGVDGVEVHGRPVVLVRDAEPGSTPTFRLTAESLRMEVDEREVDLLAAGTEAATRTEPHERASLQGIDLGSGARLFVLPGEQTTVSSDRHECSDVAPPVTERRVHAPRVGGRPSIEASLANAVAWTPCTDATVTLQGDLLVVLWDWDARLTSNQGTTDLDNGRGDPAEGQTWAREHFLYARNATLTLPPARQTVYVEDLTATAGTVRLSGAAGEMDGARVDGDLSLAGRLEVLVQGRGAGEPMAVTVGGTVQEAMLGDLPLHQPDGGGVPWWPWLLAGVGLVGFVHARPHLHYLHAERTGGELGSLIPQTMRQRRGVGLWIMARNAEGRRKYRACRRRATKANDLFRPFPEAQFTRAVAAGALGHHADAMTDFIDLFHRYDEPMGRAAAACGMAQQCVRLGKWSGGEEWLRMAAAESFEYARQAAFSQDFDHYVGEPWFDALRRGDEGSVLPVSSASSSGTDPSIQ